MLQPDCELLVEQIRLLTVRIEDIDKVGEDFGNPESGSLASSQLAETLLAISESHAYEKFHLLFGDFSTAIIPCCHPVSTKGVCQEVWLWYTRATQFYHFHDDAHHTFMTLPAYTSSRVGEERQPGSGTNPARGA